MDDKLTLIALCVESGKTDKASPCPPVMKGQDGADGITKLAIEEGLGPARIPDEALFPAMAAVGERFNRKEIYVPQMLMAVKAMNSSMKHLKPFFQSGETNRKGKFIICTVSGDLHDIGKNLVAMMIEGGGWEIVDFGFDVSAEPQDCMITLETIRLIPRKLCQNITMGASNLSFGFPDRESLNSAFMTLAVYCGVTCPIANPEKTASVAQSADLVLGKDDFANRFVEYFQSRNF